MPKILVVDDNKETVRAVRTYLERDGFEVFSAFDGSTALHTLRREHPDLVVLDLMLPDRDGLDITRVVRKDATLRQIPIIMLTARVEDEDRITGLEIGADDYIVKPFNPREVVARVRSVLRRSRGEVGDEESDRVLRYEGLKLDPSRRQVSLNGQVIDLTRIEFDLMHALMSSPEHVFTRAELIESALDFDYEGMERSLDTHIKNLRKKIEIDPRNPQYIQTVYSIGYRLGGK
ncbi:MAG TPA: response regulator transcription factor [Phototrophicaceae bacterium]|nr:response regulator transcription factor [Phototrophicaceae bacterium]